MATRKTSQQRQKARCQLCGRRRPQRDLLFITWTCLSASQCNAQRRSKQFVDRSADGGAVAEHVHANWQCGDCRQQVLPAIGSTPF